MTAMKMIECPDCGDLIPDDSHFCDQCGAEILACVNCGALGTDDFCEKCGKPMVARKDYSAKTSKGDVGGDDGGTTVGSPRQKKIYLKAHDGGFMLTPQDGAIIGRKDSPYANDLKELGNISRLHGKFLRQGRDWALVDLGSTNGSLINDVMLVANMPMKFKAGDVIDLGTYLFDVIER